MVGRQWKRWDSRDAALLRGIHWHNLSHPSYGHRLWNFSIAEVASSLRLLEVNILHATYPGRSPNPYGIVDQKQRIESCILKAVTHLMP
ncbi:hypothetical protein SISNIDRAFT_181169 [Sistotremastrum niveocremeum HHB9708]|uniref:Uncharacterized protein n=1 Tax=Sistotremastrum niveocremeum HHB9708 TaxID=1314777 RepID=A0A164RF53_9AGAM|nr:hypothetical protein SISNIDRAFT_181169 [Sistotremastrum niveocremeum HHB9708]